jgi:mRNA interferase RelE/StbE
MMWSAVLAWRIEFEEAALKELAKLDKPVARRILAFLRDRVAVLDDPRSVGEALNQGGQVR